MFAINPIVICTGCGKLGNTKNSRNFTGFLKCNCKKCEKEFLYPLNGLYFAIYIILSIKMLAVISIFAYDYVKGESAIGFLLFALPIPILILFFCVSMLVKNTKINKAIKAIKNA
jgi:hypothetical protein